MEGKFTARSNGMGNEERAEKLRRYIMGWINYFKLADVKKLLQTTDQWMRRRIRMIYWKQWKRLKTKFEKLTSLGIPEDKAWEYANTRKGYWRTSNSPILSKSLDNNTLKNLGILFFSDYSTSHCAFLVEPPYTERYVRWCGRSATQLMGSLLPD